MKSARLQCEFLQTDAGRIFVLARRSGAGANGVLIVPPFAEEMNKSRRMMTEVALALAARGVSSVCVDLYGTGDSEGEFVDANCDRWMDNLQAAVRWSAAQGLRLNALIGVRLGCLLAAQLIRAGAVQVERTVFWQPVLDGARMLDQFLRLRVAAQMMEAGSKETVAELRTRLKTASLEVAGYDLSPQLVAGIDALRLEKFAGKELGGVHWMEVMRSADAPLPAPSKKSIELLQQAGCQVDVHCVTGDPFWSSTEIVTSQAMVDATVGALCEAA